MTSPSTASPAKAPRLADYRGKVLLIVNVASQCGLTTQYTPSKPSTPASNPPASSSSASPPTTSAAQEPGSNDEIATFCTTTYSVDFPMFQKIAVTGPDTHPLYQALIAAQPQAIGPERA